MCSQPRQSVGHREWMGGAHCSTCPSWNGVSWLRGHRWWTRANLRHSSWTYLSRCASTSPAGKPFVLDDSQLPKELISFWVLRFSLLGLFNRLTPNDPYSGGTTPLTSKRCILYTYSTNTGTEYFKHGIYSPFFFSSKCSLFHQSNVFDSCIIHMLYAGCAKIKKIIPSPKG